VKTLRQFWSLLIVYLDDLVHNEKKWRIFLHRGILIRIRCNARQAVKSLKLIEKSLEKIRFTLNKEA
jgi:hypothetical protein